MMYDLPYETIREESCITNKPSVGNKSIETLIIDAMEDWALRQHISKGLPLKLQEQKPVPKEFTPLKYRGRDYLPYDIYTFMILDRDIIGEHDEKHYINEIRLAKYFMREVHKAIREQIFEIFIPNYKRNKSNHPNPTRMSVRRCLEYASERASSRKQSGKKEFLDGHNSPKNVIKEMLAGEYLGYGQMCFMVTKALDKLYFG